MRPKRVPGLKLHRCCQPGSPRGRTASRESAPRAPHPHPPGCAVEAYAGAPLTTAIGASSYTLPAASAIQPRIRLAKLFSLMRPLCATRRPSPKCCVQRSTAIASMLHPASKATGSPEQQPTRGQGVVTQSQVVGAAGARGTTAPSSGKMGSLTRATDAVVQIASPRSRCGNS